MGFDSGQTTATIASTSGYGLPGSNQVVHSAMIYYTTTETYYQISTPDATHEVYLLGIGLCNGAAANSNATVFDAAAGNFPALTANTNAVDTAGSLYFNNHSTIHNDFRQYQAPYKCSAGLRARAGGAGATGFLIINYMVVTI